MRNLSRPGQDRLVGLVAQAVRAPSSHNTQPWLFTLLDGAVQVIADRTRALPVADPDDRELTISCGAALAFLCCAARASGLRPNVQLLPAGPEGDLLAHVELDAGEDPDIIDRQLAAAMSCRRTIRAPFADAALPEGLDERLRKVAQQQGVAVWAIGDEHGRGALSALIREADEIQFHDPHFRRELAAWMHPRRRGDGLVVPPLVGAVTRAVVASVDLGHRMGVHHAELAERAPLLVVLSTAHDGPAHWLATGQALGHMLLVAAVEGVQAGYLNQPCQVRAVRPRLRGLVGGEHPQMVLRMGFPDEHHHEHLSVRRPVDEVVERIR